MGIPRLFSCLSSVRRPRNIRDLSGSCVGIDGNIWLHRSMYGASFDPHGNRSLGESHLRYFVRKCRWLLQMGVIPIVVFDGAELPAKLKTHVSRQFSRASSQARGIALAEYGRVSIEEFPSNTNIEVTRSVVHDICAGLALLGVEGRVAPYETDAQLTHMLQTGVVDSVITEDSDLLVFGCPRIISKLDTRTGVGLEFADPLTSPNLLGLNLNGFQLAAILAGCDYGPHISGLGIKKAIEISLSVQKHCDDPDALKMHLLNKMEMHGYDVGNPTDFFDTVQLSRSVFRHQTVFDDVNERLKPLNGIQSVDIPDDSKSFLGSIYDASIAKQVYEGRLHPVSHAPMVSELNIDGIVDSELSHIGISGIQPTQPSFIFSVGPR